MESRTARKTSRPALGAAFVAASFLVGCGKSDAPTAPRANADASTAAQAGGPSDNLVKVSQYGGSLYCSLCQTPDGTLHAVYTDRADPIKVMYLFYRASHDGGATWSEPKNLSDDESGLSSYYCRAAVDGKGRVYAVWKYLTAASDSLDGPGSTGCGILAYRCLENGNWSNVVRLSTKQVPSTSFFTAAGLDGAVNVVWASGNPEINWEPLGGVQQMNGNVIQQATLDGAKPPTPRALISPKPIPTKAQVDAAHAAGHDIPYEDQSPKPDGLWDLRGYIGKDGVARFIGDHQEPYPNPNNVGPSIDYFDGKSLSKLFEYARFEGEPNYGNPWTLLADANGAEHVLRVPSKAERPAVRDYPIVNGKLGDPTDVIGPDKAPGSVINWQADALPGGRMGVTCAISQKGGWDPDDVELYVATSDGSSKWSKPICVTDNTARQAFMSKQTAAGGVMKSDKYRPDFAQAVQLKDGGLGVLMVNTDFAILGIVNNGASASGQVVGSLATGSTSAPWVFFRKL